MARSLHQPSTDCVQLAQISSGDLQDFGGVPAVRPIAFVIDSRGLTQEDLAEAAGLSVDKISKIEVGASGARFPSIERLADAVGVDPAELFTSAIPAGSMNRGAFGEISAKLSSLPEPDLLWISAFWMLHCFAGRSAQRQSQNVR
jgi:transcriptional regulator with XRE-family HTH domain